MVDIRLHPCLVQPVVSHFELIHYLGTADVTDWQTDGALRRPSASPGCG